MIQFTIQDQHDKKLLISAPHSWEEINVEQLLSIENEKFQKNGLTKLFSIICGVEFGAISNSTDPTIFERIADVCSFVKTPPNWKSIPCPEFIEIGFESYKINRDVSKLMHGQLELLTELGREKENLLELMPKIVAIIMQPVIDAGDYNGERVDEIEKKVMKAPALQVYGMASFFFLKLANFLNFGMTNSIEYQRLTIRKRTYYSDWLNPSALAGSAL
jgi:hypothetical protein